MKFNPSCPWDIEAYDKDGDKTVRLVNRRNTAHEVIFTHSSASGTVGVGAYEFGELHSLMLISEEGMRFIFSHLGIGVETGPTSMTAEQA